MIRMTLAALGATLLLTASPVLAQTRSTATAAVSGTMTCEQLMAATDPHISSMKPSANKKLALDEEGMAKDSMAQHDENACRMHMRKAEDLTRQP